MTGELRLDQALAAEELARSRTHAARLIAEGAVRVNGEVALKPSLRVGPADRLSVQGGDHYVSRGAHKLNAALDAFAVTASGRYCLDVGASTGGFTQVLLERGARRVVALDVGHGQLDDAVGSDTRVISLEGVNARDLTRERLDALIASAVGGSGAEPGRRPAASEIDLVVADLSFIPLGLVLPAVRASVSPRAEYVLLVKPQFEVGRTGVSDGIVTDVRLVREALERVTLQAFDAGLGTLGLIASPITGTHGNREFLAHFGTGGSHPTEWGDRIRDLTKGERA